LLVHGSGKTTLVKLLCRLYDPHEGTITVDGNRHTRVRPESFCARAWRHLQDYSQYPALPPRQNIWVGNIDLDQQGAAIEEAAATRSDEVIQGLRRGYDTCSASGFAEGEELSIGEWQKVALAASVVRDAEILVLRRTHQRPWTRLRVEGVRKHIRALAKGRAVILISHRFSTVPWPTYPHPRTRAYRRERQPRRAHGTRRALRRQ